MNALSKTLEEQLFAVASSLPGMRLFLLFGSRARGAASPRSDWDFGYIGDRRIDPFALLARLCMLLKTDRVDLVDLERAGGLLRYRAAKDATVLFERNAGTFRQFWTKAVDFWCDAEPVLRANVDDVLQRLSRPGRHG